jgi:hypothetical protein
MGAEKIYTFQSLAAGFGGAVSIAYPANAVIFFSINPYTFLAPGPSGPYAQATLTDTGLTDVQSPNLARIVEIQNNSSFSISADINGLYDFL